MKNANTAPIIKHVEKVAETLSEIQKHSRTRTITLDDITAALEEVEERLYLVSTKKDAIGTRVHSDPNAQKFPNAYRYTPESTHFYAELTRTGWNVYGIERETCKPNRRIVIEYTGATKAAMAERMSCL